MFPDQKPLVLLSDRVTNLWGSLKFLHKTTVEKSLFLLDCSSPTETSLVLPTHCQRQAQSGKRSQGW